MQLDRGTDTVFQVGVCRDGRRLISVAHRSGPSDSLQVPRLDQAEIIALCRLSNNCIMSLAETAAGVDGAFTSIPIM